MYAVNVIYVVVNTAVNKKESIVVSQQFTALQSTFLFHYVIDYFVPSLTNNDEAMAQVVFSCCVVGNVSLNFPMSPNVTSL